MKKQLLIAVALMVSLTAFSQKVHRVADGKSHGIFRKMRIKLNLATGIFALFPEVTYERIINSDFSLVLPQESASMKRCLSVYYLYPMPVGFWRQFGEFE